jgi:predicted AAA+ superfamily ATPase
VHKLHQDLRSQGIGIGKDTLYSYVEHVQDAFLGFRVPIRSDSERVRATNPTKLYPVDPGLARAFGHRTERGHLLECAVYLELRRRGGEISWMRTTAGTEVDFVVDDAVGPHLVQVCAEWSDPATIARELRACADAVADTGVAEVVVVTRHDRAEHEVPGAHVRVVPAWAWLLPGRG